jgi:hypothetical protein
MRAHIQWIALGLALAHCGARAEPEPAAQAKVGETKAPLSAATPAATAAAAPKLGPPEIPFVEPKPWHSYKKSVAEVPPPDLSQETWRAFVNQNQPIQIKTPIWQLLPPKETVALRMPEVSKYACVVTPLKVEYDQNDFQTKLKAWVLSRQLLCSDDGWHTWTEYQHGLRLLPDGTREMLAVPQALLREREADSSIRHTFVLLRSDKEVRDATTGPPKIIPGQKVDED